MILVLSSLAKAWKRNFGDESLVKKEVRRGVTDICIDFSIDKMVLPLYLYLYVREYENPWCVKQFH